MVNIKLYTCKNGHTYLLTEQCPFCCAINHEKPKDTSEQFMKIYNTIKDKTKQEIEEWYQRYLPSEPEKPLQDFSSRFK